MLENINYFNITNNNITPITRIQYLRLSDGAPARELYGKQRMHPDGCAAGI